MLQIQQIRGEGLVPQDGDSCDPYVEIHIGGKKVHKTKFIANNNICPVWRDSVGTKLQWDGKAVVIEFLVYDHDTGMSDDFIGAARIEFTSAMLGHEVCVLLSPRPNKPKDQELLKQYKNFGRLWFTFTDTAAPVTTLPQWAPDVSKRLWLVCAKRLSCKGLVPVDGKTCDPYVDLRISGGRTFSTAPASKSKGDAVFTDIETFAFPWGGVSERLPHGLFVVVDDNDVMFDRTLGVHSFRFTPSMLNTEYSGKLLPNDKDPKSISLAEKVKGQLGTVNAYFVAVPAIVATNQLASAAFQVPTEVFGEIGADVASTEPVPAAAGAVATAATEDDAGVALTAEVAAKSHEQHARRMSKSMPIGGFSSSPPKASTGASPDAQQKGSSTPPKQNGTTAHDVRSPSQATTEEFSKMSARQRVILAYKMARQVNPRWRLPSAGMLSGTARFKGKNNKSKLADNEQRRRKDAAEAARRVAVAKKVHYDPDATIETKEAAAASREGFNLGDTVASVNIITVEGSLGRDRAPPKEERPSPWARSTVPRGTFMFPWRSFPEAVPPRNREVTPGPGAYLNPLHFVGA